MCQEREGLGALFHRSPPTPLWSLMLPTQGGTQAGTQAPGRLVGVVRWSSEPCFPAAPHLGACALLEPPLGGGLRAGPLPCP